MLEENYNEEVSCLPAGPCDGLSLVACGGDTTDDTNTGDDTQAEDNTGLYFTQIIEG